MSIGRKILFIGSFIIIDILLLGGFLFIRDITLKNLLRRELNFLGSVDLISDNYSVDIKSGGKYAILEASIKKYLEDYSNNLQLVLYGYDEQKINSFIDVSNYDNTKKIDDNLEYLEVVRNSFNINIEEFSNRLSTTDLSKYVSEYVSDDDYVQFCSKILSDSKLLNNFDNNYLVVENRRIEFNSYLDSIYNVLVFLRDNFESYTIIDGKITFEDVNVENDYYSLVRKTKRFVDEK